MQTLLLWAIFLAGHPPAASLAFAMSQEHPAGVTLTNERPTGSFTISPGTLESAPPILKLTISQVVNPDKLPFQVFVYFSFESHTGGSAGKHQDRILVGNFGLYPPDHPATFSLRASRAFSKLKTMTSNPGNVHLVLEMKRIHEASPWTTVEVTVAPPEWQRN
jgi:hypothetical protein